MKRYISEFKAIGDGVTNDRDALRMAIKTCAQAKDELVIDKPILIKIEDDQPRQCIQLYSDTFVSFTGAGKWIVDHDRIPVFWCAGQQNITIDDAVVEYAGTHSLEDDQHPAMHFHREMLQYFPWRGPASCQAVFHIRGGEEYTFNRPKFIADTRDPAKLFAMCFYFGPGKTNEPCASIRVNAPLFDGCYLGIFCQTVDGLYVKDLVSKRYGVLPSAPGKGSGGGNGGWFPPPHIIYNSAPSKQIVIDGLEDTGEFVGGGNWGQSSLKITRTDTFTIRNVHSRRKHGLMDFSGSNGHIDNLTWVGNAATAFDGKNGVFPMRWLMNDGRIQSNVHLRNIYLYDESTEYAGPLFGIVNTEADRPSRCTISNFNINQQNWKDCGITSSWMEYCDFEVNWTIRNPASTKGRLLFWSARNSKAPNTFRGCLEGFPDTQIRVIASAKSESSFYRAEKGAMEIVPPEFAKP